MKFILYLTVALFYSCNISNRNDYTLSVINSNYEGQVIDKYVDNWNHAARMFKVRVNNKDTLDITVDFYPESWSFASVGDSIIKKYGRASIEIRKKTGGRKDFSLYIPN
jgi:hypothetical protein